MRVEAQISLVEIMRNIYLRRSTGFISLKGSESLYFQDHY